jgi:hypothetical protein
MTGRLAQNMGEIINLRRARKRQASAKAEVEAAANRVAFGVSKNARSGAETERAAAERCFEAHRRLNRRDDD